MKWFETSFGMTLKGGWAVNPQEEGTGVAETSATDVPVAAFTPNVLVHAVAGSAETETPYLMSMPG